MDVKVYEKVSSTLDIHQKKEWAKKMLDIYLSASSELEINISGDIRKEVYLRFANERYSDCLIPAKEHVATLMYESFMNFLHSPSWKMLVDHENSMGLDSFESFQKASELLWSNVPNIDTNATVEQKRSHKTRKTVVKQFCTHFLKAPDAAEFKMASKIKKLWGEEKL